MYTYYLFQVCDMKDINSLEKAQLKELLDKKLTLFFVSCSIPFNIAGNDYFNDFVQTSLSVHPENAHYKVPCRQTLASSCLVKVHKDIEEKKIVLLENTKCVLLIDGWKNKRSNRKLLVCSLRNEIAHNLFLVSYDISMET